LINSLETDDIFLTVSIPPDRYAPCTPGNFLPIKIYLQTPGGFTVYKKI
jgi:hypothetical protein